MRIFITGGSGFVGGHAIERLVAAGHDVFAMARSDKSAAAVEAYGATAVRCDLDTVEAKHLEGIDAVVHAAAHVEDWGDRDTFWRINVRGTERILHAARGAGVRRFVHIGTEAALFVGDDLIDLDETRPLPKRARYLYSETKAEAEWRVLALNADGFTTLSLRPRFIWGPRDATVLPTIVQMAEAGRFAWVDGGRARTSTCHVYNLVHAIERALTEGTGGEAYFVADDGVITLRDFLTRLAATRGVTLPARSLPKWLARAAASLAEGVWRLLRLRGAPPLTRYAIDMLSAEITVQTGKARAGLGYAPVIDRERGLAELAERAAG
ncbi:MAG: NAD-dependent epimerase/dehydratase family protein [Myxococcales bacterium]|nr:NAD-dependent epimerase/dehydratase family protein [Myxococcales bacterium]